MILASNVLQETQTQVMMNNIAVLINANIVIMLIQIKEQIAIQKKKSNEIIKVGILKIINLMIAL